MNAQLARAQRIRVAIFLTLGLGLLIATILLLGQSQTLFARRVTLHTSFANTGGLATGASVRLAGVDIGVVKAIHFDKQIEGKRVDVDLTIGSRYLDRIRTDSIAQIESKGLLGDQIVDITLGSADKPALHDGDRLDSVEAAGLAQVVASVQGAIQQVDVLAGDVDARVKELLTPRLSADVGRLVHSAADVVEGVEHGDGLVHDLIYKPALADSTGHIFRDFQRIAANGNASILQIQRLLTDARTGDGLVHALVYDRKGGQAVAELQTATSDLSAIVGEVKSGHGLVHSLVYEEDKTNLIQNLSEVARVLRRLAEETDQGKGTVGGLLKDPTVYEDLTTVLENLKRNELLKALVRYTIVQDGLNRPAEIDSQGGCGEVTEVRRAHRRGRRNSVRKNVAPATQVITGPVRWWKTAASPMPAIVSPIAMAADITIICRSDATSLRAVAAGMMMRAPMRSAPRYRSPSATVTAKTNRYCRFSRAMRTPEVWAISGETRDRTI
jgi:phospholipid/cholesterol/gamma-HCH transport system substrate-binding protein